MPRNLARLRYRLPPKPVSFEGLSPARAHLLEKRVAQYVVRQSNPRLLKLQTVVNSKAKPLPTGKTAVRPIKPYTLRDLVDPQGTARHGQIIYVFRSIKTNQIIYSLQELLDDHHLAQLPFIGKHSVPAQLRPDEWTPHCVVTFATPEQGHNAFRKLREFRKLHEVSWEKTNPGWKQLKIEHRIKKIMDQRANTSADIAEVLRLQHVHGEAMATALAEQEQRAAAFMDQKWASINAIADAAAAAAANSSKENVASSVQWLEHEIRRLTQKMNMKHLQNDADQKTLQAARTSHETRLRRVQYALRKAEQLKKIESELALAASPAASPDAQQTLDTLRSQAASLRAALENPDPTRTQEALTADADLLTRHTTEISVLEAALAAKQQLATRNHHIARSVLPAALKTILPTPFSLSTVRLLWADMQDALYAAGQWPDAIAHETLDVHGERNATIYLSAEEFEVEKRNEVGRIMQLLGSGGAVEGGEGESGLLRDDGGLIGEESGNGEEVRKTGVLGMLGKVNPFQSKTA